MKNEEWFLAAAGFAFAALYTLENVFNVDVTFHSHKKKSTKSKPAQPSCLSGDASCEAHQKAAAQKRNTLSGTNPKTGTQSVSKGPAKTAPHPLSHIIPGIGGTSKPTSKTPAHPVLMSAGRPVGQAAPTKRNKPTKTSHATAAAQKTNTLPAGKSLSPIVNDRRACDKNDKSACARVTAIQTALDSKRDSNGRLPSGQAKGIKGCEGLSFSDCNTLAGNKVMGVDLSKDTPAQRAIDERILSGGSLEGGSFPNANDVNAPHIKNGVCKGLTTSACQSMLDLMGGSGRG